MRKRITNVWAIAAVAMVVAVVGTVTAGITVVGDGSGYDESSMKGWLSYSGNFDSPDTDPPVVQTRGKGDTQ